jgi:hypothetical protein
MYEAITTSYSLVYRGAASRYSPEWRVDDHLDAFGADKVLAVFF